jgi:hypothetical protein
MATKTEALALAILARRPNADPLTHEEAGDMIIWMASEIQLERKQASFERITNEREWREEMRRTRRAKKRTTPQNNA